MTRLAALGLLSGISLSPALWGLGDRGRFPVLPLLGDTQNHDHSLWQGSLVIAAALAVFIFPKIKAVLVIAIGSVLLLTALDLMRLQPWVWCYALVFTIGLFKAERTAFILLLAGIYTWSGFNKIGPHFVDDNYTWFCTAFSATKNLADYKIIGYAMAVAEMLLGLGLLWRKTRRAAGLGLILMHLIIVVLLLKLDWNAVVIPWNLCLAAMLWLITRPDAEQVSLNLRERNRWLPLAFGWGTPLLYFAGLWPYSLSWQLYSNTQPEATFFSSGNHMTQTIEMDEMWQKLSYDDGTRLLLDDWSYDALGVPMFASNRTFRQMGRYLCSSETGAKEESGLYILSVNQWDKTKEHLEELGCSELQPTKE